MSRKVCPHCGNTLFAAAITMACIVETTDDETNPFKMMKKGDESKAEIKVVKCMRCKADVTNEELLTGVACKECGRVVMPESLNADGICEVCVAKKERKELQNATPEQLIAMLLAAEKKAGMKSVDTKVAKAEEAAEAVTQKAEAAAEKKDQEKAEETTAKKSGKGKRGKAKASAVKEDSEKTEDEGENAPTEENPVTENEVAAAEKEIADGQEAPFPDTDALAGIINPPAEEAVTAAEPAPVEEQPAAEQAAPAPFAMFDNDEEQPF